jgi:hypothetical protein
MGPSSNVTHALNIVVKGIAILYFLFCQTSVLLVEQIMHAIYFIYIYISITASKICYNDIGCFSNVLPYINALGKLPLSPDHIGTLFHLHTRQNPTKSISCLSFFDLCILIIHLASPNSSSYWTIEQLYAYT